jgi:hypothetical protein
MQHSTGELIGGENQSEDALDQAQLKNGYSDTLLF